MEIVTRVTFYFRPIRATFKLLGISGQVPPTSSHSLFSSPHIKDPLNLSSKPGSETYFYSGCELMGISYVYLFAKYSQDPNSI